MKVYAVVLVFAAVIAYAAAGSYGGSASVGGYGGSASVGGYGGGATIPAPACAKSYLLSCQPSLNHVACASSSSSSGYGSSGSYSENIPTYVNAPLNYPGVYGFNQGYGFQY